MDMAGGMSVIVACVYNPYINQYCPICLQQLDYEGSCWIRCEYEVTEKYPALNEEAMTVEKINRINAKLIELHSKTQALQASKEMLEQKLILIRE